MCESVRKFSVVILASVIALPFAASKATGQTYPIDCAILLCLSGGWPASAPCARARAEFIRRITPWPVEAPLQIWRCPMGASFQREPDSETSWRLYDILFDGVGALPQSYPAQLAQDFALSGVAVPAPHDPSADSPPADFTRHLVQDRADIDISGPEFNFVRSIRVYHVRYASQRESGADDNCNRYASVSLGSYGMQGDFHWRGSSPDALPEAHIGMERWGEDCPSINHRSVFVDWRDYEGNYGFEQVNY
jgi:hypothetical protein